MKLSRSNATSAGALPGILLEELGGDPHAAVTSGVATRFRDHRGRAACLDREHFRRTASRTHPVTRPVRDGPARHWRKCGLAFGEARYPRATPVGPWRHALRASI